MIPSWNERGLQKCIWDFHINNLKTVSIQEEQYINVISWLQESTL